MRGQMQQSLQAGAHAQLDSLKLRLEQHVQVDKQTVIALLLALPDIYN